MPTRTGKDSKGCYAKWGGHGKKYYYACGNKAAREAAVGKANKQGAAAHANGYTGNEGDNMPVTNQGRKFQYVTTNFKKEAVVRNDTLEGKPQIVAPMIMITEGVHNGSDGPIFYPADELAKSIVNSNHRPVVVYHPVENGAGVSACDPIQLSSRKVGITLKSIFDNDSKKLFSEAWIDPERAKTVDNRVSEAIEKQTMMEVSTGYYMDLEKKEGVWNNEKYIGIARNLILDHLALLPDVKGACSIEDGAGFLRTNAEMGHETTRRLLQSKLNEDYKDDDGFNNAWIEEVYDSFFIYEYKGEYFKQPYTNSDGTVDFAEEPDKVIKVVEWRKANDGSFVGNENDNNNNNLKGTDMDKKKIVDSLIANEKTDWKEEDRVGLMAMNEERLTKMAADAEKKVEEKPPVDNKVEEKKEEKKEVKPPVGNTEPKKPETMEEYIAKAPEGIREVLNASVASLKQEKDRLIAVITANEKNEFTKEYLGTKGVDELRGLAKLAAKENHVENNEPVPMFFGQNEVVDNEKAPQGLPLPTMNFEKKSA